MGKYLQKYFCFFVGALLVSNFARVWSLRVASYFATLHRPTTTPTRNDLSKQTPKSSETIGLTELAIIFSGIGRGLEGELFFDMVFRL